MSRPITLFSGYSQRENRTTNYCLLILRMLYEENPKFLAQVLSTLVGDDLGDRISVKFRQQARKVASTPDDRRSPFTSKQRIPGGWPTASARVPRPPWQCRSR